MALSLSAALMRSSQRSAHALSSAGPAKRGAPSIIIIIITINITININININHHYYILLLLR